MNAEIEVVPSEDNGNVPAETPSEQPKEQAPTVVEPVATPETPKEPELFDLPDGRKVDSVTLAKEWKENFMPDYTKKSQELGRIKETINPTPQTPEKPYQKSDWQPQSWAEAIQIAEQSALEKIDAREKAKVEQQQAVENAVVTQLSELKTGFTDAQGNKIPGDPTLNENALFLHATKYGFRDLKSAHLNMKDFAEQAKKVQTTTAQNIAKRNDPVSVTPGANGAKPNPSQFGSAIDYLRSLHK